MQTGTIDERLGRMRSLMLSVDLELERKVGDADIVPAVETLIEHELYTGFTPDDLLLDKGQGTDRAANHNLRHTTHRWSVDGLRNGKVKVLDLTNIVMSAISSGKRKLTLQWESGEWRPVAYAVRVADRRVSTRTGTGHSFQDVHGFQPIEHGKRVQAIQRTKDEVEHDRCVYLDIAWVDVIQSRFVDPWHSETGLKNGRGYNYGETQLLRHMPPHLREERAKAKALIGESAGMPADHAATLGYTEEDIANAAKYHDLGLSDVEVARLIPGLSHELVPKLLELRPRAEPEVNAAGLPPKRKRTSRKVE